MKIPLFLGVIEENFLFHDILNSDTTSDCKCSSCAFDTHGHGFELSQNAPKNGRHSVSQHWVPLSLSAIYLLIYICCLFFIIF